MLLCFQRPLPFSQVRRFTLTAAPANSDRFEHYDLLATMGLFRRNKKKSKKPVETQQSSIVSKQSNSTKRSQSPIEEREGPEPRGATLRTSRTSDSSHFHYSDVHSKITEHTWAQSSMGKRTGCSTVPPPSREAAFHGPPRFDWIDIVSTS